MPFLDYKIKSNHQKAENLEDKFIFSMFSAFY
jgi:hypothetical protein